MIYATTNYTSFLSCLYSVGFLYDKLLFTTNGSNNIRKIEDDLNKKREKERKHTQTNGMYLSKFVTKQDMSFIAIDVSYCSISILVYTKIYHMLCLVNICYSCFA